MRAVLTAALCFGLGACATFGWDKPDVYGFYDLISWNGQPFPLDPGFGVWAELRPDGTLSIGMMSPDVPPQVTDGVYTLGSMKDGCLPYTSPDFENPEQVWTGSICGEVWTVNGPTGTGVYHKRR